MVTETLDESPITYYPDEGRLIIEDPFEREVELSPTENRLFGVLAEQPFTTVRTRALAERALDINHGDPNAAVRVQIHALRGKVELNRTQPRFIRTTRGRGYKLTPR